MKPPKYPPFLSIMSVSVLALWAYFRFHGTDTFSFLQTISFSPRTFDWTPRSLVATYPSHLLHLAWVFLFLLLSLGLGRTVLALLPGTRTSPVTGTVLGIIAGFGIISMSGLALGLVGLFYPSTLAGFPVLLALVFRKHLGPAGRALVRLGNALHPTAFLVLIPVFLAMLTPEMDGDSFRFHLPLGKAFLAAHRAAALPDNLLSWYSHAQEMVISLGLIFGLNSTGRCLNTAWLLLTGMLVQDIIREKTGRPNSMLLMPLLIATSWLPSLAASSKNDLFCLMAVAASLSLAISGNNVSRSRFLLLGLISGAIFSTKMVFGPYSLALILILAFRAGNSRGIRGAAAGFALIATPWMASAYLFINNPVFPLFPRLFVSPFFTQECLDAFPHGWQGGISSVIGLTPAAALLLFPLFIRSGSAVAGNGSLAFPAMLIGWMLVPKYSLRYALPMVIPILLSVVPWAASAVPPAGTRQLFRLMASLVFLGGSYEIIRLATENSVFLPFLGLQQAQSYTRNNSGNYFEATDYASENTAGKVMLIGESRKHPNFNPRFFSPHFYNRRPLLDLARMSFSADEMARRLRRAGFRWILYNYPNPNFWLNEEAAFHWDNRSLKIYREFTARWTVPRWSNRYYDERNGFFFLYEILPAPARDKRPIWFLPGTEGEFQPLRMAALINTGAGAVDGEITRMEPAFHGTGAFESRKAAIYLLRARNSGDSPYWCGKTADACISAGQADGFELEALVKSFPFPTSREIRGTNTEEIGRFICADRMGHLNEHISFALTEGFPLYHLNAR